MVQTVILGQTNDIVERGGAPAVQSGSRRPFDGIGGT
jgi:hypothetical protein